MSDPAIITEDDLTDGWKTEEASADAALDEELAEFYANACCPDQTTAARRLCGCRGSGEMPEHLYRYAESKGAFDV